MLLVLCESNGEDVEQVQLLTFNLTDHSNAWHDLTNELTAHQVELTNGVIVGRESTGSLTDIAKVNADGTLAWHWIAEESEDDFTFAMDNVASFGDGHVAIIGSSSELGPHLRIWKAAGAEVEVSEIVLPQGAMTAMSRTGSVVYWTESEIAELDADGMPLWSCPVAFGPRSGWLAYDGRTLLGLPEGIFSVSSDCASIGSIVDAPDAWLARDANERVFGQSDRDSIISMGVHSLDGTLLATMETGASSETEAGQWFYPLLLSIDSGAWVVARAGDTVHVGMIDFDSGALAWTDDAHQGSYSTRLAGAATDAEGQLILAVVAKESFTSASLQITRWNTDGTIDMGPMPSGGDGDGDGGGACTDTYSETRLSGQPQMDAYCMAAFIYGCENHAEGLMTSCATLEAFEAEDDCKYCL